MSKKDVVRLFALICALYPRDKTFAAASQETVSAWEVMLRDLPYESAVRALQAHASVSPFPPTISEIREGCARIEHPEDEMTAEEAWSHAINAVRRYGYNRWPEASASMPEHLAEYVSSWYRDICMSESVDVIRGQFCRGWNNRIQRNRKQALLPEALRSQIRETMAGRLLSERS